VAVGELICYIEVPEEEKKTEEAIKVENKEEGKPASEESTSPSQNKRYSPAVLRLAEEHQIDLNQLTGTGRGGRITRKDVLKAIEQGAPTQKEAAQEETTTKQQERVAKTEEKAPTVPTKTEPVSSPTVGANQIALEEGDLEIPVTPVRRAIANRMVLSKQEIPHAWMMVEADVSGLVKLRQKAKAEFQQREGIPLTFMPFFLEAAIEGLKAYPQLNSVWQGDKIIQKKRIHISIAVATEDSLYVPVIHDADEKNIRGLQKSVWRLAEKARNGKLELSDIQGGTFTVNNTGTFGSIASQPIINHPQAAILAFESIQKKPVFFEDGMFALRDKINLCLSMDHRILDGWVVGQFMKRVKEKLESYSPESMI
jgi:2-oxoisovalerate dehydrogenase E2 component (dihydrolipoyl transacylase)